MKTEKFYKPEDVRLLYPEIVPAYQGAFAGEPWNEVSKCVDMQQRCPGGLSAVPVGVVCKICDACPSKPAYESEELIERFEALADTRPTAWYIEQNEQGVSLAALAWRGSAETIYKEKYADVPPMGEWLNRLCGVAEIMWLDEVFANKAIQARGNLKNFGSFVTGLAQMLWVEDVAYRTIEPRMLAAAQRDFATRATIFGPQEDVPDWRSFVKIT